MLCGMKGPKYFTQDTLTNRDERFFTGEIIREAVFHSYKVRRDDKALQHDGTIYVEGSYEEAK